MADATSYPGKGMPPPADDPRNWPNELNRPVFLKSQAGSTADPLAKQPPGAPESALAEKGKDTLRIRPRLSTDKPTLTDTLGFDAYAAAIAAFLLDEASQPPLTISIQAPWGGGKTSMMLMIEERLDPKEKRLQIAAQESSEDKMLTIAGLEEELNDQIKGKEQALPGLKPGAPAGKRRTTVWFNAWKYENTNQVWAGLVDAILQQVPERLPRRQREQFWLRLNLSRVDTMRYRQALQTFLINAVLRSSAGLAAAAFAGLLSLLSAVALCYLLSLTSGHTVTLSTALTLAGGAIGKWFGTREEFRKEAASEVFKNLVRTPAYDTELGFVHQAESDLRRVFGALPKSEGLVVFIDDLDRCAPTKVAAVLEAVNLIIAGDFPDCYFVLGMDAEMVAAALQSAHKDLAASAPEDAMVPIGWRFMDKFVQLPFIVPPVGSEMEKNFLSSLLSASKVPSGGESVEEPTPESTPPLQDLEDFVVESEILGRWFLGNPRELKRFTNLLRFHWYLYYARLRTEGPSWRIADNTRALGYWTAMSVKWPEHVRWLRRVATTQSTGEVLRAGVQNLDESPIKDAVASLAGDRPSSHLAILEGLANIKGLTFTEWRTTLRGLYGISQDKPGPSWMADAALFSFYKAMKEELSFDERWKLSSQTGMGFW
jgi:KAP family P-loop domain